MDLAISAPGGREWRSGLRPRGGASLRCPGREELEARSQEAAARCLASSAPTCPRLQSPQTPAMVPPNQHLPRHKIALSRIPSSLPPSHLLLDNLGAPPPPRGLRSLQPAAGLPVLPEADAPLSFESRGWLRISRGQYSPKPTDLETPETGRERGRPRCSTGNRSRRPDGPTEKASPSARKKGSEGREGTSQVERRCYELGPTPMGLTFPFPTLITPGPPYWAQVSSNT